MNRSRTARLILLGLVPLALTACDSPSSSSSTQASSWDTPPEPASAPAPASTASALPRVGADQSFDTVADCVDAGNTAELCQKAADQAKALEVATAPRYKTLDACIADYGADMCGTHHESSSNDDWFGPFAAGFLVSHLFFNNPASAGPASPIYRQANGQEFRPAYAAGPASANKSSPTPYTRSPYALRPAATPIYTPSTASRSTTVSRGGFGGSTTSSYSSPSRSSGYSSSSSSSSSRSMGG